MAQIFGDFIESGQSGRESLLIGFSPTLLPLQQRWRNNGLSADFLADYLGTFLAAANTPGTARRNIELKDAAGYIANELLENAMKFNHQPSRHPVSITMQLDASQVCFYVSNSVDPGQLQTFQTFIDQLLAQDPEELYAKQVIDSAKSSVRHGSGLGFLTMMNTYDATLAWKFEASKDHPNMTVVTTMAQISV